LNEPKYPQDRDDLCAVSLYKRAMEPACSRKFSELASSIG